MKIKTISWKEADYDPKNSRFKSDIYFESGIMKEGYSGKKDFPEPYDYLAQWKAWVLRLYNKGYLNPHQLTKNGAVDKIEFYMKNENGDYDLHFVTLYPNHAAYNKELYSEELGNWIKLFYSLIERGINPNSKLNIKHKHKSVEELNANKPLFINKKDLRNHCIMLQRKKLYENENIKTYYRKYVSNWFDSFLKTDEDFLIYLTRIKL